MVQCEMCGAETSAPKTVKVEGAELQVCAECADFGTEVRQQQESSTTTKYSTGSGSGSGGGSSSGSGSGSGSTAQSGSTSRRRSDLFDEMDEVVTDYDDRIRQAREAASLTQAELADELNEKKSLIRKLERGETLPSDQMRRKLERKLGIELLESGSSADDESEWSSEAGPGGMTLGDVVKRKE